MMSAARRAMTYEWPGWKKGCLAAFGSSMARKAQSIGATLARLMGEIVTLRASILYVAQAPAIRVGAIQQGPRQTFRRRGGADDVVEITDDAVRLSSKPGGRGPFAIELTRDAIVDAWVEVSWLQRHLWLQVGRERHGMGFRRRVDLDQAVTALHQMLGITVRRTDVR